METRSRVARRGEGSVTPRRAGGKDEPNAELDTVAGRTRSHYAAKAGGCASAGTVEAPAARASPPPSPTTRGGALRKKRALSDTGSHDNASSRARKRRRSENIEWTFDEATTSSSGLFAYIPNEVSSEWPRKG